MGIEVSGIDPSYLDSLRLPEELVSAGWAVSAVGGEHRDTVFCDSYNTWLTAGGRNRLGMRKVAYSCPHPELPIKLVEDMRGRGKSVFNQGKIRLGVDPSPGVPVTLSETDYFSGLATNDVCLRTVRLGGGKAIDGSSEAYPDGIIPTLARSRMSNHIGVSTLAFDNHGILLLCRTGIASAVAAGRIAPSASGSCDTPDFEDAFDIVDAVTRCVSRELAEETGLRGEVPCETRLVAFLRNLHRGGKPEFVAVSRIGVSWAEASSGIGSAETVYTDGHEFLDVRAMGIGGLERWLAENRARTAYSLASSVYFLARECRRVGSRVPAMLGLNSSY